MKVKKTGLLIALTLIVVLGLAACGSDRSQPTEAVAEQIAGLTGGTLAEIQRAEEYGDLQEEAEAEILEGVRPEITVSVENVEDYDTVFVGYPKMEQGFTRV